MTRRPHARRLFVPAVLALAAIGLTVTTRPAATALAAPVNPPQTAAPSRSDSTEPAHRVILLGATIYGTVTVPTVVYDVPWQEPFLLGRGASELDRNFLKEIFRPIDREDFLKAFSPSP